MLSFMLLFLDTETTGTTPLSFVTRRNYTQWPRMVQIAWALADCDGLGKVESRLVKPIGFSIPPKAICIHRIDTDRASREGRLIGSVLMEFSKDLARASCLVGHHCRFDIGVVQSENLRLPNQVPLNWPAKHVCTMREGQRFLSRSQSRGPRPSPSLGALHHALFGESYPHRHDAEADLKACYRVYRKLHAVETCR